MRNLDPVEMSRRGKKGMIARWGKKAIAEGVLKIGDSRIECFVLNSEERVLLNKSLLETMNMARGGYKTGDKRIVRFARGQGISPYVSEELLHDLENPIKFKSLGSKRELLGYPASVLPRLCEAIISAEAAGVLQKQQMHIAAQAKVLLGGCAQIGIIGLIDESTGYQYHRERDALATILENFIAKEAAAWAKTFPDDFYRELFRLHGIETINLNEKPWRFGKITNDVIYRRLAPGLLAELERKNPKSDDGKRMVRHHQWLSRDASRALDQYLGRVIGLMMGAKTWGQFMKILDKNFPKYPEVPDQDTDDSANPPFEEAV